MATVHSFLSQQLSSFHCVNFLLKFIKFGIIFSHTAGICTPLKKKTYLLLCYPQIVTEKSLESSKRQTIKSLGRYSKFLTKSEADAVATAAAVIVATSPSSTTTGGDWL